MQTSFTQKVILLQVDLEPWVCSPAAMGAKMGAMNREVVAVIGDGGYQMTIQELGTIFQLQIPVKIVILNNDFLGMVRQWQQLF
ncbi:MAG: hypothetical protein CM15mP102_06400 [Flavobacteriales bacterium]|nr:MAG: hypothetical protein CM15mP102_06400 [Flavobacteriales bacterium]